MTCNKCGKETGNSNTVCPCCEAVSSGIVAQLVTKIQTEAKIWKIVAIVQVVIGALTIILNLINGMVESALYGALILIVAFLNFKGSKKDLAYAEEIKSKPVGIVKKYEPLKELIAAIIYNVFVGGVVGVVACVFGFMTRKFVMDNKQSFIDIENMFNNNR